MFLERFRHPDWTNQWAGRWSILSFSYWGGFYCRQPFYLGIDRFLRQSIMIWRSGKSWAYHRASEKQAFGLTVKAAIQAGQIVPEKLCRDFKQATDTLLAYTESHHGKTVTWEEYRKFQSLLVEAYYPLHVIVKMTVDALEPDLLEKYLPLFEEARVYAEPVFTKSEEFMLELAKQYSSELNLRAELILCSTKEEFETYLQLGGDFVSESILKERYEASALLWNETERELVVGTAVEEVESLIKEQVQGKVIKGSIGYPGKVTGCVRLIYDPSIVSEFQVGDILVTGMTRPEFMPLIQKAGAFVTDGGGILCHAAIVARELKKPCVIGTLVATKQLKEGMIVEVNATEGTVSIV